MLVGPGGWAPANVVAAVSRKEFPKTLRSVSFVKKDLFYCEGDRNCSRISPLLDRWL